MKNYNDIYDDKESMARFLDTIYSKGYDRARDDCEIAIKEAYQNGLNDAWVCAKLIVLPCTDGGMDCDTLQDVFNANTWQKVLMSHSASEAVAKIKEHKEKLKADKEIKIGDEVLVDERHMIVLGIDSGGWKQLWCPSNGSTYDNITTSEMTKTGKHFDIQSIIDQMNDEQ